MNTALVPLTPDGTRIDYIETYTGRRFQPLDPSPDQIDIEDIAHALSNQCRFSGHTRFHYSVAQHSVMVCRYLKRTKCPEHTQLWGLLHDASEAYLVDLPTPLKTDPKFGFYRQAEKVLMRAICQRFGLSTEEPEAVRHADAVMLSTEVAWLMPGRKEHWGGVLVSPWKGMEIWPWSAGLAKHAFLEAFEGLVIV